MDSECWEFNGTIATGGYGIISFNGRSYGTHVVSAHLFKGFDLDTAAILGLEICHICDNRRCWNPEHLFVGTKRDNFDDMLNKRKAKKSAIEIILLAMELNKGESNGT